MNHYRGRGRGRFQSQQYPGRGHYGVPPPMPPLRGRGGFQPFARGGGSFRPPFPGMPPPHITGPPPPVPFLPPPPPVSQQYAAAPPVQVQPGMMPVVAPMVRAVPPVVPPTPYASSRGPQTIGDWIIHTPQTGATYYYNTITKKSQFELPDDLRTTQQQYHPAQTITAAATTTTTSWMAYKDATTGKAYYSNGISTTWERPSDFAAPTVLATATTTPAASEPAAKKIKLDIPKLTHSEATERFKHLLEEHSIAPNVKYPDVQKVLQDDIAWQAACEVLTLGNRKQLLAEYQTKRSNVLKKQSRELSKAAKVKFVHSLHEQNVPIGVNWDVLAPTVRMKCSDVLAAEERKVLYLEYCEDVRKRNDRQQRSEKRQIVEEYRDHLQSLSSLTPSSEFPSTPLDGTLPELERRGIFREVLDDLVRHERKELEESSRRQDELRSISREKLFAELKALANAEEIVPASSWAAVRMLVPEHLVGEIGISLAKEVYDEFSTQWSERYRRDRDVLSRLLPHEVHRSISLDDFVSQLRDAAKDTNVDIERILKGSDSASLYHRELTGRLLNVKAGVSAKPENGNESSEDEGEVIEDDDDDDGDKSDGKV